MMYLERKINNTFIDGFNELKTMVSEAEASEIDLAPPPPQPPTTPSPSAASNSTDDGRVSGDSGTKETPAVFSVSDHVRSWSDSALEAVNKLSDDVEWIKWKANRVSFDILHDYGDQYGFFRLAAFDVFLNIRILEMYISLQGHTVLCTPHAIVITICYSYNAIF